MFVVDLFHVGQTIPWRYHWPVVSSSGDHLSFKELFLLLLPEEFIAFTKWWFWYGIGLLFSWNMLEYWLIFHDGKYLMKFVLFVITFNPFNHCDVKNVQGRLNVEPHCTRSRYLWLSLIRDLSQSALASSEKSIRHSNDYVLFCANFLHITYPQLLLVLRFQNNDVKFEPQGPPPDAVSWGRFCE